MAIKQDGPYDSRNLTKVFAVSSLLLVVVSVWMVLDDHHRPWKLTQERFFDIEIARATAEFQEAERRLKEGGILPQLEKAVEDAEAEVAKQKGRLNEAEKKLVKAQARLEAAKLHYADTKSRLESAVYFFEEDKNKGIVTKAADYSTLVDLFRTQLAQEAAEQEAAELEVKAANGEIASIESVKTRAEKALEEAQNDVGRARKKLLAVDYSRTLNPIVRVRDKPFVDFLDPTIRPKQIVLNHIKDDYYFAMVRKVDRCQTCHLAIERKGFEGAIVGVKGKGLISVAAATAKEGNWELAFEDGHKESVPATQLENLEKHENPIRIEEPFKSHPRLDLFLGSQSPHPMEKFGCTVCHLGEGQSIGFTTAAHTPNDDWKREEWARKHHWDVKEHWNDVMLPTRYVEASCLLCHANNRPLKGADKLNFGREVWERVSCVGCHKMRGYEDEQKRGPDLRHVSQKLTPEWVAYWLENPQRFRPKTNMPRFFGHAPLLEEREDVKKRFGIDVEAREAVEIRSIVELLFARSAEIKLPEPMGTGDAARGKQLFTMRGCVGCHRIEPTEEERKSLRTYAPDEFGPNLYNTAWKTTAKWVAAWAKDPKHYWAETKMPNLRLSDQDAVDVAAYLVNGAGVKDEKRPAGLAEKLPALGETHRAELEKLVVELLEKDYVKPERDAILAGKPASEKQPSLGDDRARLLYLGDQTVGRYGCFGCHFVKGMETRPGIGRELTDIADKKLGQVVFGFESVRREAEHRPPGKIRETTDEWLHLKVQQPRVFDRGKVVAWLDRSRMPRFQLSAFERDALVTYLLGHTKNRREGTTGLAIPEELVYKPSARRLNVIEGEYAIHRNNCKACHLFAPDRVSVTNDKGEPVTEPVKNALGEVVRSPLTKEPVKAPAMIEALCLVDTLTTKGPDGKPYYGEEGRAIFAVFGDSKTLEKSAGDRLLVGGDEYKSYSIESPRVGAEADLLKVVDEMPDFAWSDQIGEYSVKKEEEAAAEARTAREAQRAAIVSGIAYRNRGGTALDKIIRARFAAKANEVPKGLGFDPWTANQQAKDEWSGGDVAKYLVTLEDAKTYAPPHLIGEGRKVQPLWLQSFMKEPVEIRPWLEARMPTFGFQDPEAERFSRYFASTDEDRRIQLATPILASLQAKVKAKEPGHQTRTEIQDKVYRELDALGVREYFALTIVDGVLNYAPRGDVTLSRAIEEKTDRHMLEQEARSPGWYAAGYRLFYDPDLKCLTCHLIRGQEPSEGGAKADRSSWAPDMARMRERLRPEYMREWLDNPARIVHGTKMPKLFFDDKKQEILKGPASKRINAVVDWLMAGAPGTLEAFPASAKAGSEVRLTSDFVNLDGVDSVSVELAGGGEPVVTKVDAARREKSAGRTAAIRVTIPANAPKGKRVLVSLSDGRFNGRTEVSVD